MAVMRCSFFSETLEVSTSMTVILPQTTRGQIGMTGAARRGGHPVLYLLHGLSDDDTIWTRRTSIERYAADLGLAVIMPDCGRSFYADEAHGHQYWTFLSTELPDVVSSLFNVSTLREDTFVAGLSMGGYGAFKWALRQPARFAAAASLSGALDVADPTFRETWPEIIDQVFGNRRLMGSDDDLFALAAHADPTTLPALYLTCGEQDPLLGANRAFLAVARDAGLKVTADVRRGDHEWGLWDRTIQDVLAWLPVRG